MIMQAKILRCKEFLKSAVYDCSGWYRWWVKETEVRLLLDSSYLSKKYYDTLAAFLHKGEGVLNDYIYIYSGISGSIQGRLNWHINQKHSDANIGNGYLSTLRQSISSLISGNQKDETATNDFLDKLMVEYFSVDENDKNKAKVFLKKNEKQQMSDYVIPLNMSGNKRPELKEFLKDLEKCRKNAKKGY